MDLKNEIYNKGATIFIMPPEYSKQSLDLVKKIAVKETVCYITINKTFDALKEEFNKNRVNIDNILFIDAITKSIKEAPSQTNGCYFISSPAALTELGIAIDKAMGHNFRYIIFDSLTNLIMYQKGAPITRFVLHLVNKAKSKNTNIVFYALNIPEQTGEIRQCETMMDRIVNLDKKSNK
jgi:hypothetical protein